MTHNSSIKWKLSRSLKAALVIGSVTAVATGGCSSSEEKRRASLLAGGCTINSDCDPDFICAFERCHTPCKEDRDCGPHDLRCVKSEVTGIFVCQLEDERHCKDEKDCPGEQVCGVDEECRDACQEHDDCIGDQICAVSNECASTVTTKDMLDADGNIIPDPDPSEGGSGGSNGSGATSGGGAASGNGGNGATTPTDGGNGSEPIAGGGTGGTEATGGTGETSQAGATSSEGGGGPSYPPAEYEETGDGVENVNNDDRDHPVAITQSARFFLDEDTGDQDWFAYHAPDDGHAHNLTLLLEQEATVTTVVAMYAAEDDMKIGDDYILEKGATTSVYVTVGPNTITLFRFSGWSTGSEGFVYLTLTDEAEQDVHEPNNTPETAKGIELGETVTGLLLNPQQAAAVDLAQDWFEVELAQGTATFTFTTLPGEGRASVAYMPPGSTAATVLWSPPVGTPEARNLTVSSAGTYRFNVKIYSDNAVPPSALTVKPKFYYQPYSFIITQ